MALIGTKIGTGYVSIEPDFTGFQESVERSVKSRFRKVGDDAGKALNEGVSKRVQRERDAFGLASVLAPIKKRFGAAGEDAGRSLAQGVSKGARPAASELNSIARAMQKAGVDLDRTAKSGAAALRGLERDTFGVGRAAKKAGVDLLAARHGLDAVEGGSRSTGGATRSLVGRLRSLGSELRAARREARAAGGDFRGFNGTMARVNRSAQYFRNIFRLIKWPVLVAGVGLFAQGLSALAAGAVALTSALGPLMGALVALPAGALAAAQAFSVLKLATAGVGDAVKAAIAAEVKGGSQAVDTMRQQEAATERVADAKRNLTDVQRQARISQEDLTQARKDASRQLVDMRLAAEASRDSEQQGRLSLVQARKDLAQTLRDPAATGLDIRFAEEAVDQARHDLESTRIEAKRAREDYGKAQKGGIEKMPEVVAAKRAEADANRSVADAERDLAKAIRENSDAMQAQGSAATALQEKLSLLPRAGQRFVRFLVGLKPRLDALRATAANGLFPGAEEGLRGALRNFGGFRGIVDGTSRALGRLASKAGRKIGSEAWGKDLGRLGRLNTRIIERLGDSTLHLADAFRNVLVSARPFLDWLSQGTEKLSEWLSTESEAARENGKLAAFFDRTREAMERVWPILKGVGGALLNIGEAARPLGNEILDSLGSAAEGWRKWTDSTKGQNRLKQYFMETKPAVFEMGRLIRDAGKAFFELGKQDGVAELLRLVRTELVPALRDLFGGTTGWAARFIEDFGALRDQGVPVFDAFVRTLAEHAGQAGVKIAKALFEGFANASIWGKLAIGSFLLARFGGGGALLKVGAVIGRYVGVGIGGGVATTVAGGAASGAGGAAAGGLAGGVMGVLRNIKWARVGAIGVGVTLAQTVMEGFKQEARLHSDDLGEALTARIDRGPGIFGLANRTLDKVDPFGETGEVERSKAVKGLWDGMLKTRTKLDVIVERDLKGQADLLDLTGKQRSALDGMFQLLRRGRKLGVAVDLGMDPRDLRRISQDFGFLRRGLGTNLKDIMRVSQRAGQVITQTFGKGTKEARELTSRNMRLTASAIARQMTRSGDVTKEGLERIRKLIRNADLLSPSRKQAEGFGREWAKGLDQTKEVTGKKLNEMLAEARKMPAPMRKIALETWLEQAKQAEKSGKLTTDAFRRMRSRAFAEFGTFKAGSKAFNRELGEGFVDMSNESGGAVGVLMSNLGGALKALGKKVDFNFTVKKAGGKGISRDPNGASLGRQRGGSVPTQLATGGLATKVPGTSTGDRHLLSLNGVPVAKVESKEGIFVGNRNYMAALEQGNAEHPRFPRFQKGGQLGVEPKLAGPTGSLRQLGQSAIHKVFEGAKDYLEKHKPKMGDLGALGGMKASGSVGGHSELQPGISAIVATVLKQFPELLITSTMGGGHAANSLHYQGRAVDLGASTSYMLKAAEWIRAKLGRNLTEGIHNPNLSIKYGEAVPASYWGSATWADHLDHIHLGKQRGGLLGFVQGLQDGGFVDATSAAKAVAVRIGKTLLNLGLNYKGAAGVIGNAWRESLWNPASVGTGGRGLWGFDFYEQELLGEAARKGVSWSDTDFQTHFMWSGPEPASKLKGALNGQPDAATAAEYFDSEWERSGVKAMSDRKNGAREAMRLMLNEGTASGEGAAASKEKLPSSYKGAKTGPLALGAMPKNAAGVDRQIERLQGMLPTYRKAKASAEKEGKAGIAQAVGRNIEAIEQRLKGLRALRSRLRLEKVRKMLGKRVKSALGRFGGYERTIDLSQRDYESAAQYAEQVVGLEPQNPELPSSASDAERESAERTYVDQFKAYVEGQERPAYTRVLERVADWRNNVLRAEMFGFGKGNPSVAASESRWEAEVIQARTRIEDINRFTKAVGGWLNAFRGKADNKGKDLPPWLQREVKARDAMRQELPFLQQKDSRLTGAIAKARELFFPGGKGRIQPPSPLPLPGSGSLEDRLKEIQGIHWPHQHELLGPGKLAPPRMAGRFGGVIWDVQTTIEELGLKISQAVNGLGSGGGGDDSKTELLELELEKARQVNLGAAISARLEKTKELFDATYPVGAPFSGKFHSGGTVPGPWQRESLALVRGQERIRTPEQELQLAGAIREMSGGASGGTEVSFVVNGDIVQEAGDTRPPAEAFVGGQRLPLNIRQASVTGRRTPGGRR